MRCEPSFSQRARVVATAALIGVLGGCSLFADRQAPTPAAAAPVPASTPARAAAPAASPSAPVAAAAPLPFTEAVARAGERLVQDAQASLGSGARELVIDPLIDASTGQQTGGTVAMGQQLGALIKARAPQWNVQTLTRSALAKRPLLLIGTLTAINTRDRKAESADAFRVCLVLIDLSTGKLVAKRIDRATLASVNAEPTPFYRDSPTWAIDRTTLAYVKSCQGSSPGDSVDPGYLLRLPAAALINEAQIAFGANKTADAYKLFKDAQSVADPDDLRVLNGVYLTSWRTGKKKEATETFGRIVGIGLESRHLPIKILFSAGTTTFIASADIKDQYAMWIREVALQASLRETCMKIVGHTSRTGTVAANDALSKRRATAVKQGLEKLNPTLGPRLTAEGAGSRESIVNLGTDDLRDALDRRVEFRTVDCA